MKKSVAPRTPKSVSPPSRRALPRAQPRTAPVKASLEHAMLGLVAEKPGITGYEIAKIFALSMRHYWHAHQGQIYPALDRMEREGLVRSREVIQRGRPNKREFTIAPEGERMLTEWLESPIDDLLMKHSQLMRTRFLGHLSADRARAKIEEQRAGWQSNLAVFRSIEHEHFSGRDYRGVNDMFTYFTLRYGIDWMEQNIRWCDWAISELERNRGLFRASATAGTGAVASVKRRSRARGR